MPLLPAVFPVCPVAAVSSRKVKVSAASAAPRVKAKAAGRGAARPRGAPVDKGVGDEQEEEEVPGRSVLSVADAVVTEYEKLLAAIPTMARHMGKLQLDTEAMAEGEVASHAARVEVLG